MKICATRGREGGEKKDSFERKGEVLEARGVGGGRHYLAGPADAGKLGKKRKNSLVRTSGPIGMVNGKKDYV